MLKIGEFSKLSHLTVKALRFYEKEGLLEPAFIDPWTGYRFYETRQLEDAAEIKAYRQLDLSIDEIKAICSGADRKKILSDKAKLLTAQRKGNRRPPLYYQLYFGGYRNEVSDHRKNDSSRCRLLFRNDAGASPRRNAVDPLSWKRIPSAESRHKVRRTGL